MPVVRVVMFAGLGENVMSLFPGKTTLHEGFEGQATGEPPEKHVVLKSRDPPMVIMWIGGSGGQKSSIGSQYQEITHESAPAGPKAPDGQIPSLQGPT